MYSFIYGNIAVLSLDANDVSYEIKANTGYRGGAQNTWVEQTLAAYRADPNIDFIVCFFHHCAYSTTDDACQRRRECATPGCALFDSYEVDLVLQGHNHVFERTDPIRAGAPTTGRRGQRDRLPGNRRHRLLHRRGGGRPRYNFQPGEPESYRGHEVPDTSVPNSYVWTPDGHKKAEAVSWSRVRFRNYAFIRVDVRPGSLMSEMDVTAVDEYGREFDKLTYRRQVRG